MSNIILAIVIGTVFATTAILIATTPKEDKGCNHNCESCPFPPCNK